MSLTRPVTITAHTSTKATLPVNVTLYESGKVVQQVTGDANTQFTFNVTDPKIWSPAHPALYDITVVYGKDTVRSYMGFRTIETGVVKGVKRPLLNGEFVFQMGVLDQGYWPDGIYTPPTKDAMVFDIEKIKEAGFNMMRKHVKVEPALFYRACDELGILVVQDMPSMRPPGGANPSAADDLEFSRQLEEMVQQHLSHPSIITWVSCFYMRLDMADLARRSTTKAGASPTALPKTLSSTELERLTRPGSSTLPRAGKTTALATIPPITTTLAPSAALKR